MPAEQNASLSGCRALVTGGGHRVGRAIALALAAAGADVVVHYGESADEAERTVRDIQALSRRSLALQADLRDPNAISGLFNAFDDAFGRLDVLVNSAASFVRRPLSDVTAGDWDAVMEVNLRAPLLCIREASVRMLGRRADGLPAGSIVNLADLSAEIPWRHFALHGASKAGLIALTRSAARELGPDVRVNAVVPGAILPPPGVLADDRAWRNKGLALPLGQVGDPLDVGRAVVFLATNVFVTGAVLHVDGGEHLLGPLDH